MKSVVRPEEQADGAVESDGFTLLTVPSLEIHFAEQCNPADLLVSKALSTSGTSAMVVLDGTVAGQQYVVTITPSSQTNIRVKEGPLDYTPVSPSQLTQQFVITASQKDAAITVTFAAARTATITATACVAPLTVAAGKDHLRVVWDPQTIDAKLRPHLSIALELQQVRAGSWSTVSEAQAMLNDGSYTFVPTARFASGSYRSRLQLCAGTLCSSSPTVSDALTIRDEAIVFADVLPILFNDTLTLTWASPVAPYSGLYRWALAGAADGSKQLLDWQVESFGSGDSQSATRTLAETEQTQVAAARDVFVVIEVFLLEGK
jgi:hypothetical protein